MLFAPKEKTLGFADYQLNRIGLSVRKLAYLQSQLSISEQMNRNLTNEIAALSKQHLQLLKNKQTEYSFNRDPLLTTSSKKVFDKVSRVIEQSRKKQDMKSSNITHSHIREAIECSRQRLENLTENIKKINKGTPLKESKYYQNKSMHVSNSRGYKLPPQLPLTDYIYQTRIQQKQSNKEKKTMPSKSKKQMVETPFQQQLYKVQNKRIESSVQCNITETINVKKREKQIKHSKEGEFKKEISNKQEQQQQKQKLDQVGALVHENEKVESVIRETNDIRRNNKRCYLSVVSKTVRNKKQQ